MHSNPNNSIFNRLLTNTLLASLTTNFVWFALTYWIYLETKSVLAVSLISGLYAVSASVSSIFFGSVVDKNSKKTTMVISNIISAVFYILGSLLYFLTPASSFKDITSPQLWILVVFLMLGTVAGNLRMIALSTTVSMLFEEKDHAKANGKIGTINGISFSLTSIISGLVIGFLGFNYALVGSVVLMAVSTLDIASINLKDKPTELKDGKLEEKPIGNLSEVRQTIKQISLIPGMFGLIFFTTFNNFLGGVFMSLMDAYGLSLVSVQVWGILWSVLAFGFIAGGAVIAKFGLGKNPIKTLFLVNIVVWTSTIFFTIPPFVIPLSIGIFIWLFCSPFIEACEHTLIQKLVPFEKQGRVFGFASSVETSAMPITAFLIGPIAQFWAIPFMSSGGLGASLIGGWFGVGEARGLALIFTLAGLIGLIITLLASQSKSYKVLASSYEK